MRTKEKSLGQNDTQWEDNRWQQTDVGPFLAASIDTGKERTLKGIAIRVGDDQQATVLFDTARLRFSAAWTGGFLRFNGRRFGLIRRPQADGNISVATKKIAGWANGDRFSPTPVEITLPDVENGYCPPGSSVVHLPKDWAKYRGLYTANNRVVLSYLVGKTEVLETPWYFRHEDRDVFTRTLEIGPSRDTLRMLVADSSTEAIVVGSSAVSLTKKNGNRILIVPPHEKPIRVKLMIVPNEVIPAVADSIRQSAGEMEHPSEMIKQDFARWPHIIETKGSTTESGGPYVIDTITIPFDNPYRALMFTSGHDFFRDGSAAVCTVHGDVWVVEGIDRQLTKLTWKRYATGLFQPLGLKIVNDKVHVIGRDQITRLHDRNNDGEADFYENFNNSLFVSPNTHDYVTCLDTDPRGNFYFIHGKTGVMRVSADGSQIDQVADGFRNPNGMAVGPDGTITAAPQQGQWTPESSIIVVKEGGYYGFRGPRITSDRPTGWDLPMCFIPRKMDNSGGAQVWVTDDRWGPLEGKMLHLSYGQCRILLALSENVDGVTQGGTTQLLTTPQDFESGIMRGRFRPQDGQLYVSGLRGWQTRSIRDGCFQRVRYTGESVSLPVAVKTFTNGIKLTFAEPLQIETARDPDNFFVTQWNYRWSSEYGSPEFSVANPNQQGRDEVPVVSSTLQDDGYSVFLEMPDRQPVNQINIDWLLATADGKTVRGNFAHTINTPPVETMPEDSIVRWRRPPSLSNEEIDQLRPGLLLRISSQESQGEDFRISRLAAIRHPVDLAVTPFLDEGPFALEASGTLQIPLSGDYDFRIEGNGIARVWINGYKAVDLSQNQETTEPLRLRKGHNQIRIAYLSPTTGVAEFELFWKGYNFDWEPLPPKVLFHPSQSSELTVANQRRMGRELFADHHCARCHQTHLDQPAMIEMSLTPPDLSAARQRFNPTWLVHWLRSPYKFRPNSHMPGVLQSQPDPDQAAADIATFLCSIGADGNQTEPAIRQKERDEDLGESLFEQLGCIACHHFKVPQKDDERLSLHFANAKFPIGGLQIFLRKPAANHSATRMPDFELSEIEAAALSEYIRSNSKGQLQSNYPAGDANRGGRLFAELGCQNCHSIGDRFPLSPAKLPLRPENFGCIASTPEKNKSPSLIFNLSPHEKRLVADFIKKDLPSLQHHNAIEASHRLYRRLRCNACHDRDEVVSRRRELIAEEGSGRIPDTIPNLTWAGERFNAAWTEQLIGGELDYKPRPWQKSRMPSFPRYAQTLAHGMAAQHAVSPDEVADHSFDDQLATIGEKLTLSSGLDCRQCHAIGNMAPRGDEKTQISLGINFTHIRDRLRRRPYHRFMMDPARFDPNTKMIRFSANGKSTKLRTFFDADAKKQFEAIWHYIQELSEE